MAVTVLPKIKTMHMPVSPQQAMHWLEKNQHNRPLTQSVVDRYARDMLMGRWKLTHQGIAIADDHTIIDGQHRLWAIIEAKLTVIMQVTTGLPLSSQDAIDGGLSRSARDVLALREGIKMETLHMGVSRMIARQLGAEVPTRTEIIDCFLQHRERIEQAIQMFPHRARYIRTATIGTVITRAIYTQDATDVARFCRILANGLRSDDDEPQRKDDNALLLRKFITGETSAQLGRCLRPTANDVYFKTERALRAYLDGDRIKSLYAASEELFLLPTEHKKPTANSHSRRAQLQRAAARLKVPHPASSKTSGHRVSA